MSPADLVRVARNRGKMLRRDSWRRERLLEHQAQALAKLRAFAYERSPFYRKFHAGGMGQPLEELPVLDRTELMRSFDDIATDRAVRLDDVERHLERTRGTERFAGRFTISASSGSSGQRGFFAFAPDEWGVLVASYGRPLWWAGLNPKLRYLFRPFHMAVITSPVPWHQTAQVRKATASRLAPSLTLDSSRPIAEAVPRLNDWQPQYLATYASLARALAEEQLTGRLRIQPRMVAIGGEVLTAEARRLIEQAWGKVLYDTYGASEVGILASECERHGGMHLCEDLSILEIVDARGRPVAPGETGERLLVTSLYRYAQPLIRYELSDRVRLAATPCPCGRPFRVIDAVEGRVEETLHFRDAQGAPVAIDPVVFDGVLDALPARQWQVVQTPASLDVLLVALAPSCREETVSEALQKELSSRGAIVPPIRIRRVDAIPRGATGKAPLIRRASE